MNLINEMLRQIYDTNLIVGNTWNVLIKRFLFDKPRIIRSVLDEENVIIFLWINQLKLVFKLKE